MRFKILTKYVFPLVVMLLLAGCQDEAKAPPVLKVGGRQLSLKQFERELQRNYPDLSTLPKGEQSLLKQQLVNRLVERELILSEADRLDIRLSPDELDVSLRTLRGNYSAEEFERILQDSGQTPEGWAEAIRLRLLTEKVTAAVLGALSQVSEEEIEAYYREHRDEFKRPAELRARQMLFRRVEKADMILQRLREGEDFASLAVEHSLSPDREAGGDLGYFSRGQLPPEFDRVLFRLPIGRVSEPVKSPYGYHLFLVESERKAGLRPLEQVRDEIVAKLVQQREEAVFQEWVDKLRGEVPVVIDWPQLGLAPKKN